MTNGMEKKTKMNEFATFYSFLVFETIQHNVHTSLQIDRVDSNVQIFSLFPSDLFAFLVTYRKHL